MNAVSSEPEKLGAGSEPSNGLVYNDELLESLATIILLGSRPGAKNIEAMPYLKKMLYDYDIYMLSFMSDEDVEDIAKSARENGINGIRLTDKKLKEKLTAIRDNARVFVNIAIRYNSVRAYIDRTIGPDPEAGKAALEVAFTGAASEYKLKLVGAAACKKLLEQL